MRTEPATIQRNTEQLSEDAKLLMRYLEQYKNCRYKKRTLERRRQMIINEFESPLTAMNYDGMPKGNKISVGAASLAIRLDEIDTRIREQRDEAAKKMLEIMDILDFLPSNEPERDVLEARYIDCYGWTKTCREINMTRTPAYKYLRKGINKLLEFKRVKKILEKYAAELAAGEN